jgi:carbonic anhydrase/acetyltransferase-like protein (isoleucine patch superfamily)
MPVILPYKGILPTIHPDAFIAENAVIIGDVEIGAHSSIWYNCVVRGDVNFIRIGARTNIQDGSVIHVTRKTGPTFIGSGITIGHSVTLHACKLEDDCFIGMGSLVMDDVVVEKGGMLGAGSMLTPGKILPSGELWAGRPAKPFRAMTDDEKNYIPVSANNYVELAKEYMR